VPDIAAGWKGASRKVERHRKTWQEDIPDSQAFNMTLRSLSAAVKAVALGVAVWPIAHVAATSDPSELVWLSTNSSLPKVV